MLVEGRNYFSQMVDVFHVKPNFSYYWCMANLMAYVGLILQEAVDILRNIPVDRDASPETSLWAGLLGSSRFQGYLNSGGQIANKLIEQDPQKFSYYMLLVNVYAVAGEMLAKQNEAELHRVKKQLTGCRESGILSEGMFHNAAFEHPKTSLDVTEESLKVSCMGRSVVNSDYTCYLVS
ncbi:unnamed protein product [Fraxinus pennsylvanica]|uniref:Uncharacterized protein n=1 Tax=Fraxinus pennsylvanica TaxID=56036 RepID=A0AAD2E2N5_9LAMI|nr:unnamed protein product [Fraxinus pennsylvanica]